MSDPLLTAAFLVVAGGVAGVLGTAGGITSLVSYPALLAVGTPPLQAAVANLVAGVVCWPASAAVSRGELGRVRRHLPGGLLAAALGGAVGTLLLLATEASTFNRLVPFLVALGSVSLLVQPRLTRRPERRWLAPPGFGFLVVAAVSIYGGYFGAGSGIMVLATSLILFDPHLPNANALKNSYVGAAAVASATIILATRAVPWAAVGPLTVGLLVGSLVGPRLVRRLPPALIRWFVGLLGLALAAALFAAGLEPFSGLNGHSSGRLYEYIIAAVYPGEVVVVICRCASTHSA